MQFEKGADMEIQSVVDRVRGEFNEMPGLQLTPEQAARLLGLDRVACDQVIARLVAASFLRWSDGRVMRDPAA
jgi:hypothetical protein